jgi:hypothetical protein
LQPKLSRMTGTSRAYLHCRTSPSARAEQIYERAKSDGMDFVTITDRDSIDGVRAIADRPDVFMSVELTARLRDSDRAVPVCCHGISEFDHAWLQRRSHDLEVCLAYLREHSILFSVGECPPAGEACVEAPHSETPWEFLTHVRRSAILGGGCAGLRSSQGSFSLRQASMPLLRWDRAA